MEASNNIVAQVAALVADNVNLIAQVKKLTEDLTSSQDTIKALRVLEVERQRMYQETLKQLQYDVDDTVSRLAKAHDEIKKLKSQKKPTRDPVIRIRSRDGAVFIDGVERIEEPVISAPSIVQVIPTTAPIAPATGKDEKTDSEEVENERPALEVRSNTHSQQIKRGRKSRFGQNLFTEKDVSFKDWLSSVKYTSNPKRGKAIGDRIVEDKKLNRYISCLNTLTELGCIFDEMDVDDITTIIDDHFNHGNGGKGFKPESQVEWLAAVQWYYRYMNLPEKLDTFEGYFDLKKNNTSY